MLEPGFLDRPRLLRGPWQAFERDVARLMIASGFDDVRLVGGAGDRGADVLGVREGQLWVFQCKHTTLTAPPKKAVSEVVEASQYYGAARRIVAVSRTPSVGMLEEVRRYKDLGYAVEVATPEVLLDLMAASPEYSKNRRVLRDYQSQAVEKLREVLLSDGRGQIVLATGLGKTVVMAEVVSDLLRDGLIEHGRVLIIAHTRDLIEQLHKSFWYQLPKWVRTGQLTGGEDPILWDGIIFATVQSVFSRRDLIPPVGLVVFDEAHHVGAATFREVIEALQPKMLAGATATPWRGDGFDVNSVFGSPVVQLGIAEGLRGGFLSDVDYRLCADNIDWELVQDKSVHNYSLSQLNRNLIIPTRDEQAVRMIRDVFDEEHRRAGIIFCPSVLHAKEFAAMLRQYGFRAEAISGELPARERAFLMARFRAGGIDIMTSVDLFNEGVDVPDVDMVVFMRATHSRRIFVQQLGRGLRTSPGKDRVIVLDFVTDLRRIAEVVELDGASRGGPLEKLGLGERLIEFRDESAGSFLREWMLDQASLILREGEPMLEIPNWDFPKSPPPGSIQ